MRSTFYGLEIAKTGLFIAQNQQDITAHNMANVNTVGYTRQRLATAALPPSAANTYIAVDRKSTAGRGVETIHIEQVRNPFLDYQYRRETAVASNWQTREQYFEYVESLFNGELDKIDDTTGMTKMFNAFYGALHELSKSPSDPEIRKNVRQHAENLTSTMNYYYNRLIEQQNTLNESIKISVGEINGISKEIAELNEQIYGYELSGARANDLRDERNLLLDKLAGIVDIDVSEDLNGQLVVQIDGKNLIRHASFKELAVNNDVPNAVKNAPNVYGVYWTDSSGNATNYAVDIKNGALRGYMDVRDGDSTDNVGIPYVIHQLDALCKKIAEDVNAIHKKGYIIPNDSITSGNKSISGILFFDDAGGTGNITAQNFRLSDAVLENVNNIAASDMEINKPNEENTQLFNGKIALAICELMNKKDPVSGHADNFDSAYQAILTDIASKQDQNRTTSKAQSVMQAHLEQQRKSISTVSLDEEVTNMVRFGHAYQAASRMISAVDEQLDTLINKMGLVGRS